MRKCAFASILAAPFIAAVAMGSGNITQGDSDSIADWWPGRWVSSGGDCRTNYIEITYADRTLGVVFVRPDETQAVNFAIEFVEGVKARVVNVEDGTAWDIEFLGPDHHTSHSEQMSIDWRRCDSRSI